MKTAVLEHDYVDSTVILFYQYCSNIVQVTMYRLSKTIKVNYHSVPTGHGATAARVTPQDGTTVISQLAQKVLEPFVLFNLLFCYI